MLLDLDKLISDYNMKVSGVLHVGAHHGQEIEDYKRHGIQKIVMVEPQPVCQEVLDRKYGDDENITLFKCAVGSKETSGTTVTMHTETANQGQSSSLLEPVMHLQQYPHIVFDGTIEVPMSTVDEIMEGSADSDRYNFINMDVQGYELEVLKGSINHLHNVEYIMTEVNRAEVYKGCPMVSELDDFLSEYGFVRVETSWAGYTWGDALYVKRKRDD